jgi:hypothetical protein
LRAGLSLTRVHGCESILLAGTDLALVFRKGVESGIARSALADRDTTGPLGAAAMTSMLHRDLEITELEDRNLTPARATAFFTVGQAG